MKRFDLCIVQDTSSIYYKSFAFILDEDTENYYHVEIWNFKKFEGAELDYILRADLRLATEEEIKEYQVKFKEYCDRNENPQI
jgi:hypothetical protein